MPTVAVLVPAICIALVLAIGALAGRPRSAARPRATSRIRLGEMRAAMGRAIRPFGAFVILVAAVLTLVTGVLWAIGLGVRQLGSVDALLFDWLQAGRGGPFSALAPIGDTYACLIAGAVVAIVYALLAQRRRWAGAVAIAAALVLQHYLHVVLAAVVDRAPPQGSTGTYPAAGAARAVVVYGTCAFALLRLLPLSRRRAAVLGTLVALVAFIAGWSQFATRLQWGTDVLAGWLAGVLLLLGLLYASSGIVTGRRVPGRSGRRRSGGRRAEHAETGSAPVP
ncbi:MAG: hypothetical protein ACRDMV_11100 [Streptosporangiales bacterium]